MKVEYDAQRDLLYIWFAAPGKKAAQTITVVPGVYADIGEEGRIVGIEVLDASELVGRSLSFEVALTPTQEQQSTA